MLEWISSKRCADASLSMQKQLVRYSSCVQFFLLNFSMHYMYIGNVWLYSNAQIHLNQLGSNCQHCILLDKQISSAGRHPIQPAYKCTFIWLYSACRFTAILRIIWQEDIRLSTISKINNKLYQAACPSSMYLLMHTDIIMRYLIPFSVYICIIYHANTNHMYRSWIDWSTCVAMHHKPLLCSARELSHIVGLDQHCP